MTPDRFSFDEIIILYQKTLCFVILSKNFFFINVLNINKKWLVYNDVCICM